MVLPSTNPVLSTLVMLVMSLLLLLLLLQGTGRLLLAMAGRTAENHILASVAATKLL
jgi:hypothetical protein